MNNFQAAQFQKEVVGVITQAGRNLESLLAQTSANIALFEDAVAHELAENLTPEDGAQIVAVITALNAGFMAQIERAREIAADFQTT